MTTALIDYIIDEIDVPIDHPTVDNTDKFLIVTGTCNSEAVDKEASVPLDVKNYYNIYLSEIKNAYYDNYTRVRDCFNLVHQLEQLTLKPNKIKQPIWLITSDLKIRPCFGSYPEADVNFSDLFRRQTRKFTISDLKINLNRIYTSLVKEVDSLTPSTKYSFQEVIDQIRVYIDWFPKVYPSKKDEFSHNCLFHDMMIVMNYYRQPLPTYNNFTIYSSYNKVVPHSFLSNLIRIHTLNNYSVHNITCTCYQHSHLLTTLYPIPQQSYGSAIIYNNCNRNLFAAFKRQCKKLILPDPTILRRYTKFVEHFFYTYLEPKILHPNPKKPQEKIDYSYEQWFNKETAGKQKCIQCKKVQEALDLLRRRIEDNKTVRTLRVVHELFCKAEKQEPGGKNRAIAAINQIIKVITGPLCWLLEYVFDDNTNFYSGHKNADDYSKKLTEYYKKGMKAIEGDGSGFDQTQYFELKVIDRLVYTCLAKNINLYHINDNKDVFVTVTCTPIKVLDAIQNNYSTKKRSTILRAEVIGTVFSGAADTTVMNTMRMATYNMFTLHETKLLSFQKIDLQFPGLHKGDDFLEFAVLSEADEKTVIDTYNDLWCDKNNAKTTTVKGIGQIKKMLYVHPITSASFCSSIIFPDGHGNVVYVRDPQRMVRFTPFSRKALGLNMAQRKQYLIDQAIAIEASGTKELPVFNTVYKALMKASEKINFEPQKINGGASSSVMQLNEHRYYFKIDVSLDEYRYDLDYYYSRIKNDRDSAIVIDEQLIANFIQNLHDRYGWLEGDIVKYDNFIELVEYDPSLYFEDYALAPKVNVLE
jgi:hypothetical protein